MCGLSSSQVFLPLCHALVVGRLNVLFFCFFFNLSFTGFTLAGGESSHLRSDSRIETSSQKKRVCGPNKVDKKEFWCRIGLTDSEVTLWYFSSNDKQPSPSEELEESKEVQESKGKRHFLVGGQTGEDCLPYLTDGLKSRVRH